MSYQRRYSGFEIKNTKTAATLMMASLICSMIPVVNNFYIILNLTALVYFWMGRNEIDDQHKKNVKKGLGSILAAIIIVGFLAVLWIYIDSAYPNGYMVFTILVLIPGVVISAGLIIVGEFFLIRRLMDQGERTRWITGTVMEISGGVFILLPFIIPWISTNAICGLLILCGLIFITGRILKAVVYYGLKKKLEKGELDTPKTSYLDKQIELFTPESSPPPPGVKAKKIPPKRKPPAVKPPVAKPSAPKPPVVKPTIPRSSTPKLACVTCGYSTNEDIYQCPECGGGMMMGGPPK